MKSLEEIRKDIDRIDNELVGLLKERMDCAKEVGYYKKEYSIPVLNVERENEVLKKVETLGGEYGNYTRMMYSNIMSLSRALQYNIIGSGKPIRDILSNATHDLRYTDIKAGYQGIKGANSHEAALKLFGESDLIPYKTFSDVFNAVDSGEITYGILPVENSNAGSVSEVYDLILKHRFYIVKAIDLNIRHYLCSIKQADFTDIETVCSHPQALTQCKKYIGSHGFTTSVKANTAIAARDVSNEKSLKLAAVCTKKAAEEYGLKILDENIQDNDFNTTRFIVISKQLCITDDANKISLCFSLPHVTGSLYATLSRFNSVGLNLTKIESRPIRGREFEYLFYLDFTGNVSSKETADLISQLSEELLEFSFLGNYSETE